MRSGSHRKDFAGASGVEQRCHNWNMPPQPHVAICCSVSFSQQVLGFAFLWGENTQWESGRQRKRCCKNTWNRRKKQEEEQEKPAQKKQKLERKLPTKMPTRFESYAISIRSNLNPTSYILWFRSRSKECQKGDFWGSLLGCIKQNNPRSMRTLDPSVIKRSHKQQVICDPQNHSVRPSPKNKDKHYHLPFFIN